MKRPPLFDLDYDPMHPENVAARALDPDDGIDYEELIAEIVEDERAGNGIHFSDANTFLQWFDEMLDELLRKAEEADARDVA